MGYIEDCNKCNYGVYSRILFKTLKKLRRSWKYKDYIKMGNILTNMEIYKNFEFYDDPFTKYGIKKVVETYWRKYEKKDPLLRLTDKMQKEMLVYPESLLDKMSNMSANNNGLNIKFTLDNPDKLNDSNPKDVGKFAEMLSKWRDYTGNYEPLDRMVYRGGGYEPY